MPEISSEDIKNIFFWSHLRLLRVDSKLIPKKIRRKLKPEEWVEIRRNLEHIAHQARYALAYIEKMDE